MDELEKRMLKEVAELDSLPVGAFNIRSNGKSEGRCSTANIQIESRESGDGINVYFKDGTKNVLPYPCNHQQIRPQGVRL